MHRAGDLKGGGERFSRRTRDLLARADAGLMRAAKAQATARELVRDAVVAVARADCAVKTALLIVADRPHRPSSNGDRTRRRTA